MSHITEVAEQKQSLYNQVEELKETVTAVSQCKDLSICECRLCSEFVNTKLFGVCAYGIVLHAYCVAYGIVYLIIFCGIGIEYPIIFYGMVLGTFCILSYLSYGIAWY